MAMTPIFFAFATGIALYCMLRFSLSVLVLLGLFLAIQSNPWTATLQAWLVFFVVAAGFAGCVLGGVLSRRHGERNVALVSLCVSATACLLSGFLPQLPVTVAGATYAIFAYVSGHTKIAEYLQIVYVPGAGELAVFCAALGPWYFTPEGGPPQRPRMGFLQRIGPVQAWRMM